MCTLFLCVYLFTINSDAAFVSNYVEAKIKHLKISYLEFNWDFFFFFSISPLWFHYHVLM